MAEYQLGRLLDHVHLRVRDVEASRRFYRAVLAAVGRTITLELDHAFAADELFVSDDGEPTAGLHLAFQAADRETVQRFHEAGLTAGGRDNGAPSERAYHPGYHSAYLLDPDGNTWRPSTTAPPAARPSRSLCARRRGRRAAAYGSSFLRRSSLTARGSALP